MLRVSLYTSREKVCEGEPDKLSLSEDPHRKRSLVYTPQEGVFLGEMKVQPMAGPMVQAQTVFQESRRATIEARRAFF